MYQPSELVKQRIINRTAPFTNEFFDSLVDVLYMGLKLKTDLTSDKVYEMFFYDAEGTHVMLIDLDTEDTFSAEIATCTVWNGYENRPVGGLQSVIDVLETLMPKGE